MPYLRDPTSSFMIKLTHQLNQTLSSCSDVLWASVLRESWIQMNCAKLHQGCQVLLLVHNA